MCRIAGGIEDEFVISKQQDIIYKDEFLTAFVSSHTWPRCEGNVIIIPNSHFENIYEMPDELLEKVGVLSKKIAIKMKEKYLCDGVSTRQHNEEAGNQDVWHYHFHVVPRYLGDNLYINHKNKYQTTVESRVRFVELLKDL
jgi:histidine triad (HIT) family protein